MHALILYHFPGQQEVPPDFAAEYPDRFTKYRRAGGPVKAVAPKPGLLIAPGSTGPIIGYDPERQTWEEVQPGVWIGIDRDFSTDAFLIPDITGAYVPITLGDGRTWRMPILNPLSPNISLPTCDKLLMGQWKSVVKPAHTPLADKCQDLIAHFTTAIAAKEGQQITIETDLCRPIIAAALSYFYDLTLLELSTLGIFSADIYWEAFAIIVDFNAVMSALQGSQAEASGELNPTDGEPATSPTDSGETDAPPATSQAA